MFPVQFVRKRGDYDLVSAIKNLTGNAALVTGAFLALSVITYLALKALGFTTISTVMISAIPITITAFSLGYTLTGIGIVRDLTSHRE